MLNQAPQLDSARALRDAMRVLIVAHGALDDARRPCGARLPRCTRGHCSSFTLTAR